MHEVALSAGPVAVILIGIVFSIFYNQRAIDTLQNRMGKLEGRVDIKFSLVRHTLAIIQNDLRDSTAYSVSMKRPSRR